MKLSVIIPSYCADKHLHACLTSIKEQTYQEVEVIVVDCSPNDNVKNICLEFDFVEFVAVAERFNPGKGRNIGAEKASGDMVVFIDADVVMDKCALEKINAHAIKGMNVFGAALELNKSINNDFAAGVEHYYFNHESQSSRTIKKRNNLSSAFMIINRELFISVGGFADIARMQDTELTERLISLGEDLFFTPDVIGLQIQDSPLTKVLKKIAITGNNLYFIRYQKKLSTLMKIVFFLLLPLLMLLKITRINARNLRYSFSLPMLVVYVPFMYVCGLYWLKGMYKGMIFNSGIESGR